MPLHDRHHALRHVAIGVLTAAAVLAAAAPAPAATGWRCSSAALSGSVLGQALPGAVSAGSTTADCAADQATAPLSVPPLLDLGVLTATTGTEAGGVRATGGIVDLAVHVLPSLPVPLPAVEIPPQLQAIQVKVPLAGPLKLPVDTLVSVDLTPAIRAVLPANQLPARDLLTVAAAEASATGQCRSGKVRLTGTSRIAGVTIAGQEVDTSAVVDRSLRLDTGAIDLLNGLDLSLVKVTLVGGLPLPVPVDPGVLLGAVRTALAKLNLTTLALPATLAQIKLTPGGRTSTADGVVQRALRIEASVAGMPIADLTAGRAAVSDAGVDCFGAPSGGPRGGVEGGGASGSPPSAPELALACTKRKIVLIDVLRRRGHVKLLGAADRRFAGRTVRIVFAVGNRTVARAKVRNDGSFSTTAPLPARRLIGTNRARYAAVVGRERSLNLKLTRRMVVESIRSAGGRVRIRGRVVGPLARPARHIVVKRRLSCSKTVVVARVRPARDGRFSVSVKAPAGRAAVYRLSTQVLHRPGNPRLYPTFTLPRAVDL